MPDPAKHDLDLSEIDERDEISGDEQHCLVWCNTHHCFEWHWIDRDPPPKPPTRSRQGKPSDG